MKSLARRQRERERRKKGKIFNQKSNHLLKIQNIKNLKIFSFDLKVKIEKKNILI